MIGKVLTGQKFNEKYQGYNFFKFLGYDLNYNGFIYKNGLNVDTNSFNPTGEYSIGGLFFIDNIQLFAWMLELVKYDDCYRYLYVSKVTIPNNAIVYIGHDGYKSDKLIVDVNNKIHILKLSIWNDNAFCKYAIKKTYKIFKYIQNKTEEMRELAVEQNGLLLEYIEEQTERICKLAVKQDGLSLKFVKEQTDEICILAVQQNGYALRFVKKQNYPICFFAYSQNKDSIQYVQMEKLTSEEQTKFKLYLSCDDIMFKWKN